MKCYWCDTELIIGGDIDIEEDMSSYPEFSVMTNLSCPKCFSEVEIFKKKRCFLIDVIYFNFLFFGYFNLFNLYLCNI